MAPKTAGVIIIGDEILKGHVVDSNSHFLCKRLYGLGVKVCKMSVVSDDVNEIAIEVASFSQRYDVVFTSGGIGPTHDDITYLGVAKAFNQKVEVNQDMAKILARFYDIEDLNDVEGNPALKMAQIPEHSKLLYLPKTSKSVNYDQAQTWMNAFPIVMINNVYIFPGIPRFFEYAAMNLEHLFKNPNVVFHTRELYVISDEVPIAPSINRAVEKFRDKVTFGSYPSSLELGTRIIMESTSREQVEEASAYLREQLPDGITVKAVDNACDTISSVAAASKVLEECCNKYSPSEVFISFNGGKDCTALLHLACEVFQKRFPNCKEPLQALYIQPQDPFPEVEEFITDSVKRYNIKLKIVPGPIKSALNAVLQENPHLKAVLMGTRRTDPYSESLTYFQMTDKDWPQVMRVSPLLDWSYKEVWTYLKDRSVPYCVLYDKGYTSLGSRRNTAPNPALRYVDSKGEIAYHPAYTLEDETSERNGRQCTIWSMEACLKFLENLESLTNTAFGPEGRALMIQKSTGQLSITRSGHNIISSAFSETHEKHPVLHMLLKYVDAVHESLGDGTKTFIIMLASLLRYSKVVENRTLFIRHLNVFQSCLSELTCSSEQSVVNTNILNDRETCFKSFVNTFFSTRFSEPVRNVLSPLMHKWIMSYSNGCDQERHPYSSSTLKMLKNNFAFLCEYRDNNGRPVTDSSVQKGFRIACRIANLLGSGLKKLKFLMLEDGEKPESGQFTAVDVESEVSRVLLTADGEDTLLITSAVLSDLALFRLKCSHVAVLHGLQHEDVSFIYSMTFRTHKTKEVVIYVGTVVENGKEFVYLDLPDTFQLHICGPTSELNTEYAKECHNMLKLLLHAAATDIPHIVETGGVFEKCLSIKFMSLMNKSSRIPLLGLARNRAELLALHKELQKLPVEKKSEFVSSVDDGGGGECVVDNGDGLGNASNPVININKNLKTNEQLQSFTLLYAHDFMKLCNTSVNADESCSIVNNLLEKCFQMDESLLTGIAITLQSVQRKLPAKTEMHGLEPLTLKLSILHQVVSAVVSLLRIDEN